MKNLVHLVLLDWQKFSSYEIKELCEYLAWCILDSMDTEVQYLRIVHSNIG
ncbi:hypothetical protein MHC_06012 [Mycoplasma haemocanis str. Illinois]|uniref:Uncharacterized protein n=1 Tax=Mycoplasma haemocanis (strain Illinois) TaxID=1111676 RepID=I6QUL8_MYCHN|nr:hypothetical protein MHC_06012 [Mycoplasma haemocanis str. Illinois]